MAIREFAPGPAPVTVDLGDVGRIEIRAVDGRTIYVSTPQMPVTIRNIAYNAAGHFLLVDGEFRPSEKHSPSARRERTYEDASPAALRDIVAIFRSAAEDYVRDHPEALLEAEAASASNAIMYIDRQMADLGKQLADLSSIRDIALARENEALAQLDSAPTPTLR